VNKTIGSQTIVENGVAYFGSWNGHEYAVNASTGAARWNRSLGAVIQDIGPGECYPGLGTTATASYYNGVLYVYGANASLDALDPATGAVLWSTSAVQHPDIGYYGWSSPLLYKDDAYVGLASQCNLPSVAAGLVEISLASHQVVHRFNTSVPDPNGSRLWSSPSLDLSSNTIYITTGDPYGSQVHVFSV
jgi:outer membrane protein assembly factor BamB